MPHTRHAHGPLVRALREAKGLTLREVGQAAGVSTGYLSRVERGDARTASPRVTKRLADALGVLPEHLTGQKPPYRPLRAALTTESRAEFAEQVGVAEGELADIEAGAITPTVGEVYRIAQRLGLPASALIIPARTELEAR